MYKFIRRASQSDLIKGSFVVFLGQNFGNLGQFLYNLSIARILGPSLYGDFGAILSVSALFSAPLSVLSLMATKNASSFFGKGESGKIAWYTREIIRKGLLISFFGFIVFLLTLPWLSKFLQIQSVLPLVVLIGSVFLAVPLTIYRSVLRGILLFNEVSINSGIETYIKLLVTLLFIFVGWGLFGTALAIPISSITVLVLILIPFKKAFGQISMKKSVSDRVSKGFFPIMAITFCFTSFYTSDIILVRHFFDSTTAGQYVVLSTVGKIILFLIGPVVSVMFPLVTVRREKGEAYLIPLLGTLVISLLAASVITLVYFLFPGFIISFFFGQKYLSIVPYLGIYAIFTSIYTLNNVLMNFFLSISDYRLFPLLVLSSFSQIVFIFFFHRTISDVISVNIISSIIFFSFSIIYLLYKEKQIIFKLVNK